MPIKSMFARVGLVLGIAAVAPSSAQAQVGFVAQASYGTDYEALGIGGGVSFGLGSLTTNHGIRLETTFDYFLMDDPLSIWEINSNLLKDIPSVANLYVGAGVSYAHLTYDSGFCGVLCDVNSSEVGLNLLGGYKLGSGKAAPFIQARLAIGGGEQFVLTGGFRF